VRHWLELYRNAGREAWHRGSGRVMIAFHMYCAATDAAAEADARSHVEGYLQSIVDANSDWASTSSKDYPNHPKMIAAMKSVTYDSVVAGGGAWVGSPATIRRQIERYREAVGEFEIASLQVNSHTCPVDKAEASMRRFAAEVMPHFR
jgi:alkanesulfonate monooxygenase SsuD/methylene tetrahydromethanopterin reductase-like flavin-dependent oxidoreductase (luciferase family)